MNSLVVHKLPLSVFEAKSDVLTLKVQPFAKILRISRQYPTDPTVFVWYACNPILPPIEDIHILMVGTGHPFPAKVLGDYLGTEIFHDGALVLHFFLMKDREQ